MGMVLGSEPRRSETPSQAIMRPLVRQLAVKCKIGSEFSMQGRIEIQALAEKKTSWGGVPRRSRYVD